MVPVSTPLPKIAYLNKISKMTSGNSNSNSNSNSQILIAITVLGSPGPIRLLVNKKDSIEFIIRSVLKVYHRQGRLPILGREINNFYLYHANIGGTLSSMEAIGSTGCRNFLMCEKPIEDRKVDEKIEKRGFLKTWLNKSLNFTIASN